MTDCTKSLYQGRIIRVGLETVTLPDGRVLELESVRHPGGAAVAAVDAEGRVCLVRQYRHAGGGWLWELPAGKIDNREDPMLTAQRELLEEAGVDAREWSPLGSLHSSPGVFDEVIHLFLAMSLVQGEQRLEADELLEVHWLPLEQALEWAADGRISDAKSIIGLFRAANVLGANAGNG